MTSKKITWISQYKKELIVAMAILILPFAIYIHLIFDSSERDSYVNLFGILLEHGYKNDRAYVWMILNKLIPFLLLIIWFFTSAFWWRYFILTPITAYVYGLMEDCLFFETFYFGRLEVVSLITAMVICITIILLDKFYRNIRNQRLLGLDQIVALPHKKIYVETLEQLNHIKNLKSELDQNEYSARLLFLKMILKTKAIRKMVYSKGRYLKYTRKRELIFISSLLLMPIILYLYRIVPRDVKYFDLIFFTIDDNGFVNLKMYIWFLCSKLCVIIPLIIWYYTSRDWWRYSILAPIILYTYQFWEANLDIVKLDAYSNVKVFPLVILVVFAIIILSNIFRYRYGILDIYEDIEKELDTLIEQAAIDGIHNLQFIMKSRLNSANNLFENELNLEQLKELRQKIIFRLRTYG